MSSQPWITSTGKQDASFAGALRRNFTRPWSPNPLAPQETNYGIPLPYLEKEEYTDLGSSGLSGAMSGADDSECYFFVVGDTVFRIQKIESLSGREEAEYLLHDLPTTLEAAPHHGWSSIFHQETATTMSEAVAEEPVIELPEEISKALDRFAADSSGAEGDFDRLEAYEHAESIVELLEEYSGSWEYVLALRIPQLEENRRGVLYGALADCEVGILNPDLLNRIADDIGSENKSLAQSAAACLYWCGYEKGRQLLMEKLDSKETIPHRSLIVSLMKLLR